jgi:hypothetical protein
MNKRLPYEEQMAEQLKQVSLPDENMAWADMKRRLERMIMTGSFHSG